MNHLSLVFIALAIFSTGLAHSQEATDSELFLVLKEQDHALFERGFNQCDLDYLETAIHQDLTFFHDQSGIQYRQGFFESIKNNICSNPSQKPIRKLTEGSLEVFPLYNNGTLYGAIQKGSHEFYIRQEGRPDRYTSTALFTHVWLLEDGHWLLRDVLSFDHGSP